MSSRKPRPRSARRGRPKLEGRRLTTIPSWYRHPGIPLRLDAADEDTLRRLLIKGLRRGIPGRPVPGQDELTAAWANQLIAFLEQSGLGMPGVIDIASRAQIVTAAEILAGSPTRKKMEADTRYVLSNRRQSQEVILRQIDAFIAALVIENNIVADEKNSAWYRVGHGRYMSPNIKIAMDLLRRVQRLIQACRRARLEKPDGELFCLGGCGRRVPAGVAFCPASARRSGRGSTDLGTCYEKFHKQLRRWRAAARRAGKGTSGSLIL